MDVNGSKAKNYISLVDTKLSSASNAAWSLTLACQVISKIIFCNTKFQLLDATQEPLQHLIYVILQANKKGQEKCESMADDLSILGAVVNIDGV